MNNRSRSAISIVALLVTGALSASPASAGTERIKVAEGFGGMNAEATRISEPDSNGVRYVAGGFTRYRQLDTGPSMVTDPASGEVDRHFPRIDKGSSGDVRVTAVAADGTGGYYVAFEDPTTIGGEDVGQAAHITADGTLDTTWKPTIVGTVKAILVAGDTIYLGGGIYEVGGETRTGLAAVDATTGAVKPWNPGTNDYATVYTLAKSGSTIYAGGDFEQVGGQARKGLAEIGTDGTVGSLTANVSNYGRVDGLAVLDGVLYVAGSFTTLGGTARSNLAAVDTSTRALTSWNPGADSEVSALATIPGDSTKLVVGGWFSTVGGQSRSGIAIIGTGGTVSSWNANITDQNNWGVSAITAVQNGSDVDIHFVGPFHQVQDTERMQAAAVKLSDGSLTGWDPDVGYRNGDAEVIASLGSKILIAGHFDAAGGIRRQHLAAFDADGNLTSWNPGAGFDDDITDSNYPNRYIQSLLLVGDTLYVSGNFGTIGSPAASRTNFAALSTTDGSVRSWAPTASSGGYASSMTKLGSSIYMVGFFSTMGGQARYGSANVDATTGAVGSWSPYVTPASAITNDGTNLYVGGTFTTARSQGSYSNVNRYGLAAFDTSGTLLSFNPMPTSYSPSVRTLAYDGSGNLYVGGQFTYIGSQSRNGVAAIKTSDGTATSWNAQLSNGSSAVEVNSISLSGTNVMVGGIFTTVGAKSRRSVAAISTAGVASDWDAKIDAGAYYERVNAVSAGAKAIVVGGFSSVDGSRANGLVVIDGPPGDTPPPATPILSGTPSALTNSTTASISFSSTGATSYTCSVDGGAYSACTSPKSLTGLADGPHSLAVKGVNTAGESSAATASWTVDATPPAAPSVSGAPSSITTSTSASISFTSDPGATFTCSVDGGVFATCSSPRSLTGLALGAHSFAVKATDAAGNTGPARTISWTIQSAPTGPIAPPTTPTTAPTKTVVYNTATKRWTLKLGLIFSTTDPRGAAQLMTVQYSVDVAKPSDSQPIPTRPSAADRIRGWATVVEVQSLKQPTWVRVGNRGGKWTGWVQLKK